MPPTVSFVIPTFHRPDALRATLDAVLAVDYPPDACEVIVVDNAEDLATERMVRAYMGGTIPVFYEAEARGGSARARNHGARVAAGELLILLDDDILVESSHVRQHLETRERYGDCLIGGTWKFAPETVKALKRTPFGRYRSALDDRFRGTPDGRQLDRHCWQVDGLAACNLLISRDLFWQLRGFDEEFPFAGAEDRDFSMRAIQAGRQLIRDDANRLLHNDQTVTLQQFCLREERSAQTAAVLARKHPQDERGRSFAAVNGPISLRDPIGLTAKKLVKLALAPSPVIRLLHATVPMAERLPLSPRTMGQVYSRLIGVHIFRGFRSQL